MTFQTYEESTFDGSPLELYRFTVELQTFAYTNNETPIAIDTLTYQPAAISRGAVAQNSGESAQLLSIVVPQDHPLTSLFRAFLPAFPVGVTILRRHRTDPDAEFVPVFIGTVATCTFEEDAATISAYSILGSLKRRVPWLTYQRSCNWALYSPACGVNRELYRLNGTVLLVNGLSISSAVFLDQPSGWLTNGWIYRESTRETRFITSHAGDTITIQSPFPGLTPLEEFRAYAGCARTETVCASKFNNLVRYAGWPDVPTKNPFTGNIYGTGVSYSGGGGLIENRTRASVYAAQR